MHSKPHTLLQQIWDVREGRLLFALHGHSGAVAHAAFSPDAEQTLLASAGKDDQVVKVWRANLGIYAQKQQQRAAALLAGSQRPTAAAAAAASTTRPASAPPAAAAEPSWPLQRFYHYHDELPAPAGLARPAYQRPTPASPASTLPLPEDEDGMQPLAAGWGSGDYEAEDWQSTLRGPQRGAGESGDRRPAGVVLPRPSAPPAEEQEEEDLLPRRRRPPRPDSAGTAPAAPAGAPVAGAAAATISASAESAGSSGSQQQLQQTLLAMTNTMSLIAERLALVEDRLAGATIGPAPGSAPASAASPSSSASVGSATLELPASMRAAAGAGGAAARR